MEGIKKNVDAWLVVKLKHKFTRLIRLSVVVSAMQQMSSVTFNLEFSTPPIEKDKLENWILNLKPKRWE